MKIIFFFTFQMEENSLQFSNVKEEETLDLQAEYKKFTNRCTSFQNFVTEFKDTIGSYEIQSKTLKDEVNQQKARLKSSSATFNERTDKILLESINKETELEKFKAQYEHLFGEKCV